MNEMFWAWMVYFLPFNIAIGSAIGLFAKAGSIYYRTSMPYQIAGAAVLSAIGSVLNIHPMEDGGRYLSGVEALVGGAVIPLWAIKITRALTWAQMGWSAWTLARSVTKQTQEKAAAVKQSIVNNVVRKPLTDEEIKWIKDELRDVTVHSSTKSVNHPMLGKLHYDNVVAYRTSGGGYFVCGYTAHSEYVLSFLNMLSPGIKTNMVKVYELFVPEGTDFGNGFRHYTLVYSDTPPKDGDRRSVTKAICKAQWPVGVGVDPNRLYYWSKSNKVFGSPALASTVEPTIKAINDLRHTQALQYAAYSSFIT